MEVGKTYVFIGESVKDEHFKNFTYGNNYKISSISTLADTDIYGDSVAILFENFSHGCLDYHFKNYFINLEDFRNKKIKKIIND
jgi:hypothetical protein